LLSPKLSEVEEVFVFEKKKQKTSIQLVPCGSCEASQLTN